MQYYDTQNFDPRVKKNATVSFVNYSADGMGLWEGISHDVAWLAVLLPCCILDKLILLLRKVIYNKSGNSRN